MLNVIITRDTYDKLYTTGTLKIANIEHTPFYTLELPWLNNHPQTSCIPTGTYTCIPHGWEPNTMVREKQVWEITHVPNRVAILIHSANFTSQLLGCCAVGKSHGLLNGQTAVLNSKQAIQELRSIIGRNNFNLTIQNASSDSTPLP